MSKDIDARLQRRLHRPKDHFVKRSLCLLQDQFDSDSTVPSEEETEKEIEDNEDLNQTLIRILEQINRPWITALNVVNSKIH